MSEHRPESLALTWLGHATVALDIGGVRVLTDPVLRRSPAGLDRVGPIPSESAWAGTDAILLSHLHQDHADLPSLRLLDAPVLTQRGNDRWVIKKGRRGMAMPVSRWQRLPGSSSDVEVRLVHAVHRGRPMPHRPNAATGFLLRTPHHVVWFAGDTELYAGMEDVATAAGRPVDLALVPIGGWGPRLSPGHMGPDEAAEACRRVGARHAVAIHHGTFHPRGWPRRRLGWMQTPGRAFPSALAATAPGTRLVPAGIGEHVPVPA